MKCNKNIPAIPGVDVIQAVFDGLESLAANSGGNFVGLLREAFGRPYPASYDAQDIPQMFFSVKDDYEKILKDAGCYHAVIANRSIYFVETSLRKLPGVSNAFRALDKRENCCYKCHQRINLSGWNHAKLKRGLVCKACLGGTDIEKETSQLSNHFKKLGRSNSFSKGGK